MDTTVRNLDEEAYRAIKARAAIEGKPVGEVISEAIRAYIATAPPFPKKGSLVDLPSWDWGPGNERVSKDIDKIVYGI